jgi:ubiquinone/menaquinone biosynthesis C-methylase UbiE
MNNLVVNDLFCCPICKSFLLNNADIFTCSFCKEKFLKNGNVYDFRINNTNQWDNNRIEEFKKKLLTLKKLPYFSNVLKEMSADEYCNKFLDNHLKEIDEHMRSLIKNGINIGQRYDNAILRQGNEKDLDITTALNSMHKIKDDDVIVDLGCGTLRITKELLKRGFKNVIAIDLLSELMLYGYEKLRDEEKKNVLLVKADVRFLPLKESSVDHVISLELFEHIDAPLLLLLDLKRLLRNDGIAVINTWNASEIRSRWVVKKKGNSYYENGFYYRLYKVDELKKTLDKITVDYFIRPHAFYSFRFLLRILGSDFAEFLIKVDRLLSCFLPSFLFHHLIFGVKKRDPKGC